MRAHADGATVTAARPMRRVMPRFPALSAPKPLAIAHRGGAWESPENSAEAFSSCYALGFRYFETDVRATADGVALAFHDAHLERLTGSEALIRDTPWDQVQRARIHGHAEILRLDELLMAYPDVVFNVDVKETAAIDPFVEVIRRTRAGDRVVVASFSHRRMSAVREALGPRQATSLSPREVIGVRRAADGRATRLLPRWAACAQVPEAFGGRRIVDEAFVEVCHDLGMQVHVWTVDEPETAARLLQLGVDGIMTDRPSMLKATYQQLGCWYGAN
jgi:glycerophosphoryl diester phosphodiesterase